MTYDFSFLCQNCKICFTDMFDMSILTERLYLAKDDIDYEDVEKISLLERDEGNSSCGFKVLNFDPYLGKRSNLKSIFSIGLVQPPTRVAGYLFLIRLPIIFGLVSLPSNSHHQKIDVCGGVLPINIYKLSSATTSGRGLHKTITVYRIWIFLEPVRNARVFDQTRCAIAEQIPKKATEMIPQHLSNALWAAAYLKHTTSHMKGAVRAIINQIPSKAKRMKPQELSNRFWAEFLQGEILFIWHVLFFFPMGFARSDLSGSGVLLIFISIACDMLKHRWVENCGGGGDEQKA